MATQPAVSVIINTDGRLSYLRNCLDSLNYLRYTNFEIIVVSGPTDDGTREFCESLGNKIKFSQCPTRNISQSRNIALKLSSADLIAFLDDDSIPESEWLSDIVPSFENPQVAAAGGFLYDHTGKHFQWKFGTLDRFGTPDQSWNRATPEFNFPGSFNYPHIMANSLFRRSAVVAVGGFDEEFEYYLDESDLILRLIDCGYIVSQLDSGFVHHKYAAGTVRNHSRVVKSWYSILKNKLYFSILHASRYASLRQILDAFDNLRKDFEKHTLWAIGANLLDEKDAKRFHAEVRSALAVGLSRGLNGMRRLPKMETPHQASEFRQFDPPLPERARRCIIFLLKDIPFDLSASGSRRDLRLALHIGQMGHHVHIITNANGLDSVDFERHVWVHRISVKSLSSENSAGLTPSPFEISTSFRAESDEIASRRSIDAVIASVFDELATSFCGDERYRLILFKYAREDDFAAGRQTEANEFSEHFFGIPDKIGEIDRSNSALIEMPNNDVPQLSAAFDTAEAESFFQLPENITDRVVFDLIDKIDNYNQIN